MAEIGVDDPDDRRPRRLEPFDDRRPEPELAAAMNHLDPVPRRELVSQRPGAVRRIVVDDDELAVEASLRVRGKHGVDQVPEPIALVVGRDDDGQGWGRGGRQRMRGGQRMRLQSTITQPAWAFLLTVSPRAS